MQLYNVAIPASLRNRTPELRKQYIADNFTTGGLEKYVVFFCKRRVIVRSAFLVWSSRLLPVSFDGNSQKPLMFVHQKKRQFSQQFHNFGIGNNQEFKNCRFYFINLCNRNIKKINCFADNANNMVPRCKNNEIMLVLSYVLLQKNLAAR